MGADAQERGPKRANGVRENQLLELLQRAGTALTPGEVTERLADGLTYSSVVTILTRMHTKGLLTRTARGRAYAYAPVTDDAGFAARRMRTVLESRPDREAVLARFADELSGADADLLRNLLGPEQDLGPEQGLGADRGSDRQTDG
ncbi:BlaI/MecI/CopY family transcriptional regulator [Streptomyces sp. NPDC001982]|uniref:BlaI/MecI/CopY family transcriptional regulator n=1 Tax=unclassified Streptomyces TaxID=2593676 RepID=UPI00332F9914